MDGNGEIKSDPWELEPAFELEVVRRGVGKGKRHFSFRQYLGWMVSKGYAKDEAEEIILAWNKFNRPPIPDLELRCRFERYWTLWSPQRSGKNF